MELRLDAQLCNESSNIRDGPAGARQGFWTNVSYNSYKLVDIKPIKTGGVFLSIKPRAVCNTQTSDDTFAAYQNVGTSKEKFTPWRNIARSTLCYVLRWTKSR